MAKGKGNEATRFKPGVSGNPNGRPPEPEVLKTLRRLTKAEIADMGTLLLEKNLTELEAMSKQKDKTTGIQAAILGMLNAATKGNPAAFDKLLDRIVGKQKDHIQLSGAVAVRQRYAAMSDEELKKKAADAAKQTAKLLEEAPLPGQKKASPSDPAKKPAPAKVNPPASPSNTPPPSQKKP